MTKKIDLRTLLIGVCIISLGLSPATGQMITPDNKTAFLANADRETVTDALRNSEVKLLIVGEQDKKFLTDPMGAFWNDYIAKGRFNEESCARTDRPFTPCPADVEIRGVKEGDVIETGGVKLHVLETPGLNQGTVSYYTDTKDGHRVVYTGDLIRRDGKIASLYDLQNNFPEAEIGPYHGFMAGAPKLIAGLEKIRAIKPGRLVSCQSGKVIENPDQAIDNLITRLRAVYRNYLSTCALWWYFGEKRMNASAKAILGDDFDLEQLGRMPEAKKYENPEWLTGFSTTRLIRSETGNVFVMDAGDDGVARRIIDRHKNGDFKTVDGIFVTHYHHDHNTGIPKLVDYFSAPVYGTPFLADILERPGAYRMPCLQNVTFPVVRKNDGETMKWHEFEFTFFDFPGQTLYHNALLVRKGDERPVFFIGDSFTPTGIDDYSAWNRNFLKDGRGYLYCLEKIRSLDPAPLLVNAHVEPPFELDAARLDYIEHALRERMKLLADLLAVPEINFGLDHAWCRFDPFVTIGEPGEEVTVKMVITNHFDRPSTFCIELEPGGDFPLTISPEPVQELTVESNKEQSVQWTFTPKSPTAKIGFLSAKVTGDGDLTGRCEVVIKNEECGGPNIKTPPFPFAALRGE